MGGGGEKITRNRKGVRGDLRHLPNPFAESTTQGTKKGGSYNEKEFSYFPNNIIDNCFPHDGNTRAK